jgi:hypothetical protein
MARRLGGKNTMIVQDNISNSELHLHYRMPESAEIVSYRNGSSKRVRNALVNTTGENRLEHGKKILTGFREGDFEKEVDGAWVPISSDPQSKNYDPDWKKIVAAQAPDLVELLAVHVFDAGSQVINPAPAETGGEDVGES